MADIGISVGLDTSALQQGARAASDSLGEMYDKMAGMKSDTTEFASMSETVARLEEVKRGLNTEVRSLENGDKKGGNAFGGIVQQFMGGGPVGFLGKLGIAGAITAAVVKGIDWGFKTVSGKQQTDIAAEGQYLNGDVMGANITEKENSWWTKIPLVGGMIKSGIQVFDTNTDRRVMTELNAWLKESAPSLETLGLYGNLNQNNAIGNSRKLYDGYSRMAELVSRGGTGYGVNDGIEAKNALARYGVLEGRAELDANSILKWQRATGAERSELIDFVGYNFRYGNSRSATDALGYAYGGLFASGMEKGQFSEFLHGIQSVMEEGISKGFVVGAEEVSRNMSFFSKLTGNNVMWSGENAARKISGINSSLENSTSLDSVAAVMNFQVAQSLIGKSQAGFDAYVGTFKAKNKDLSLYTGTFLDPLMAMEKGLKTETVGGTMEALRKMYNIGFGSDGTLTGDIGSAATMLSQMWGLNNTGAVQIMKTWAINHSVTDDDIKKINSDPNMLTKETRAQKTIEDIRVNVEKIASRSLAMGEKILNNLLGETEKKQREDAAKKTAEITVTEAQENASVYAPPVPMFDRTYMDNGGSYQNYNPVNEKWEILTKEGLLPIATEVKDMSSPMSRIEWANSDGWGGVRTLSNYDEGLKNGEAYHSKTLTGQEVKGFFFNGESMEEIKEKEKEFRLPDSEGGFDLSASEKSVLNEMYKKMYMNFMPQATDKQIERFLQIIADNTTPKNEPMTITINLQD